MAKNTLHDENTEEEEDTQEPSLIQKDRSLLYMGVILGIIILVMGYLTFFVDEPWKLFKAKKQEEKIEEKKDDDSAALGESASMSDGEVRSSLVKFIDAYYYDEKRGYFDPPSYFANITETFYNYHNLTYDRLKDIYWQRRQNMENLRRIWIVSSLKFERQGERIAATYWVKESYHKPSLNQQYSANVQYEMIIDEDGKIVSLRDVDVKNEQIQQLGLEDSTSVDPATAVPPQTSTPVPESGSQSAPSDTKVYSLTEVEVQPEFNGGQKELVKYVATNIKYPAAARQSNIQGKVTVGFVVERDGSVTDVKVIKGIGGGCDEEAVRLIKNSPKWRAGVLKGAIVRTSYTLPITFQLGQ